MRLRRLIPFCVAAVLAAQPSVAFVAANGMSVEARKDGTLQVPFRGLTSETSFWCAVGDYVTTALRKPGKTRIFRLTEPPRRQGAGVVFSLDPKGAATSTGVSVYGGSGPPGSLSAGMSYAFCPPRFPFRTGFGLQFQVP